MRSPADLKQRGAFAAAWRRDAGRPVNRKKAARLLKASKRAEARYVTALTRIMRGVHAGFMAASERAAIARKPELEARAAGGAGRDDANTARPAPPPFPHAMRSRLFAYVEDRVGPAFDLMSRAVAKDNAEGLALLGIQPAWVPGLAGTIAHARSENVKLVQAAAGEYADQVEDILTDPETYGLRVEEIRKLLVERGNVSESRASFLARDQTLRTNAAVTKARQQAAGVSRYTWSTSQDERVRPMHEALEGEEFDYDDPPVTTEDGETNNPGEDWQCRCVAIPIITGLEEDEPEEEETPGEIPDLPEIPDVEEIPELEDA